MGGGGCCWCWDGGVGERCSLIGIDGVKERGGSVVVVGGGEGVEKGDGGRWSVDEKEQSVHTSFPYYLI